MFFMQNTVLTGVALFASKFLTSLTYYRDIDSYKEMIYVNFVLVALSLKLSFELLVK